VCDACCVVVLLVGAVSRWSVPRHCWWHTSTQCWRMAQRQKRSTCAGQLSDCWYSAWENSGLVA